LRIDYARLKIVHDLRILGTGGSPTETTMELIVWRCVTCATDLARRRRIMFERDILGKKNGCQQAALWLKRVLLPGNFHPARLRRGSAPPH